MNVRQTSALVILMACTVNLISNGIPFLKEHATEYSIMVILTIVIAVGQDIQEELKKMNDLLRQLSNEKKTP